MDPITISIAVGVASKAFSAIKEGFAMGRDIEQMSGDLSRWMGASSDIDNADKQAKNPGIFGKVFGAGSIESTALQAYSAKKKLEEQRYELKMFLNLTIGPHAYDELLQMEGEIRKERQRTIYKQQALRKQIAEIIGWVFLFAVIVGFFTLVTSIWIERAEAKDYTRQQKIQKGIIILPTMTTCRLKKRKVYKDKLACIYVGAQKTFTLDFTDLANGCPRKYKCVLDPNGKEPSIDSVMESLRSIAK
tara:strand:+ start:455 stop:1195 length:741 start_codon:yes stop_codon:yes gene_type:complete